MNKVVVITGASSGLGLSHAIFLTYKGYTVFGTSRKETLDKDLLKELFLQDHTQWKFVNKEKTKVKAGKILAPKELLNQLDTLIAKITYFKMDVTSDSSVREAINEMEEKAKAINNHGIDILINNAGVGFFGSVEDLSMEEWKQTFDINFFGMLRVIRAILPFMFARGSGQIINTSSLGGFVAIPYQTHYSAAKAAVKILSEGLNMELKSFNIKVSALLPSDINTSFNINTYKLTKETNESLSSIDLEKMLANPPIKKNSRHYAFAKRVWKVIVQNLIVSPPPLVVSRKIAKILRRKNPKISYQAGSFEQKFLIYLIRRIFPDTFNYTMLAKYYGL